jgi:hypothetical protein
MTKHVVKNEEKLVAQLQQETDEYRALEAARDKKYRALCRRMGRFNAQGLSIDKISAITRISKSQVGRICAAERSE